MDEKLIYQINSAVNTCNGRISCGGDVDQCFTWLQEELDAIYRGDFPYIDE